MKLNKVFKTLNLELKTDDKALTQEVTGVYVSDLLSDVMANAKIGNLWLTLQVHQNIMAVASLKELSGVLLVNNRQPETETIKKANEEGIPILVADCPAFELSGELFNLMDK